MNAERTLLFDLTPTEWLTITLVAVTIYYAIQTARTVREMRAARAAQVQPNLALSSRILGAGNAVLRFTNVGQGPALDAHVTVALVPNGPTIEFSPPVVVPGESHEFVLDDHDGTNLVPLDMLTQRYEAITLAATCKDAMGDPKTLAHRFEVRQFWSEATKTKHLMQEEPIDQIRKAVEKMEEHLKTAIRLLKKG